MVLASHLLRGQSAPRSGGGVPKLCGVDPVVHVDEACAGGIPAGGEDGPVGQHRDVVLPSARSHGARSRHLRARAVQVDRPGARERVAAPGDEDLADVVHGVASVVAVRAVTRSVHLPCARAAGVQAPHPVVRTGVERPAVGRDVHPRVERLVERGAGEPADGPVVLPHLGHVGPALGDQHLPVPERGDGRIPAIHRHVGAAGPGVRGLVEEVRLIDPVKRRVLVASGREQGSVHQVRETAAEDVEARSHRRRLSECRSADPRPWPG